jgi:hypothetical protein
MRIEFEDLQEMAQERNKPPAEDEIECPRCGALATLEYTRCPNCGLSFYPPDEDPDGWSPGNRTELLEQSWERSLAAIIMGCTAAAAIAYLIQYIASLVFKSPDRLPAGQLTLLLAAPFGAFAGGYIAAEFARQRPLFHGSLVGTLTLGPAFLLELRWQALTLQALLQPVSLANWALTLVGGAAGAGLYRRRLHHSYLKLFRPPSERELYHNLLTKVGGDRAVVERLIEYELSHAPGASRAELLQRAIQKWERENR